MYHRMSDPMLKRHIASCKFGAIHNETIEDRRAAFREYKKAKEALEYKQRHRL